MQNSVTLISHDDRKSYFEDGYVVVRQALEANTIQQISHWVDDILAWPEQSGRHWVYHEASLLCPNTRVVSRMERLATFHNGLNGLCDDLKETASLLLGEDAVFFKDKLNFKMPGGDGFKPHQDIQAGWRAYASQFVTIMVTIDPATLDNGCLRVVKSSHKGQIYREWEPISDTEIQDMVFEPCPTQPGDIVCIDGCTPHSSEPNMSQTMRRLYFVTYNKASEGDHSVRYFEDKYQNYPPDIDRVPGKSYTFKV